MRCSWVFAVALLAALPGMASAQLTVGRGIPNSAVLSRYGLEVSWTGQAVLNPSRDKLDHVVLDEELVYLQGSNGVITAFEVETGKQLWANRLSRFEGPSFAATSNEQLVLVVSGMEMYALEKRTGQIWWNLRLPSTPSTKPAIDEEYVYIGTLSGSLYTYKLRQLRRLYLEQRLPDWSYQAVAWRYQASREITVPPIPLEGFVNFASRDGSMYSITRDRRKLNFQFETNAPIVAPMALLGETMFLASDDHTFYALNPKTGSVHWEFITPYPIRRGPVALGTTVYLSPERGGFVALDVHDGHQKWMQPRLSQFVALIGGMLVTRDADNNLALLDAATGDFIGRIPASFYERHAVNDRSDRIILATTRGQAMVIRDQTRSFPIFHRYPERRPILPEFASETGDDDNAAPENPNDN